MREEEADQEEKDHKYRRKGKEKTTREEKT